ncbi:MAG: indolepyruvate ferredoxin oxidoreductase subunit alpha [Chloroflexi bacterium]|nr:indolepyruvate ferredoxin oxidoreductase subunit alpha [Chloroflexota bacterium]
MSVLTMRDRGRRVLALGNEAIARGALEAEIGYFSTYPGTPASEVGDSIYEVIDELKGLHFEYSTNEMVAFMGAVGANLTGVRAISAMKHQGVNVIADALGNVGYRGGARGLVIISGGDPGQISSNTEQENRWYAPLFHVPLVVPSTIQEAKDFTIEAFQISEEFEMPVMLDVSIQLCHSTGDLELGELPEAWPGAGRFKGQPRIDRRGPGSQEGPPGHIVLLEKEAKVRRIAADTELNRILPGSAPWGVITSGTCFGYTLEALNILGLKDVPVLKLGLVYPIAPDLISRFARGLKKLIIVEELDGFIENQVKGLAYDLDLRIPIVGKEVFPATGAFSATRVADKLSQHLELPLPQEFAAAKERRDRMASGQELAAPARGNAFCPGCPHRGSAYAIKLAKGDEGICGGDIGCYAMASGPPYNLTQWGLCMGASIGVGQGVAHKLPGTPVMAIIGDSTFFHSGLPSVVNAVQHKADFLLIILDNYWTSMTGHQPVPSTPKTVEGNPLDHVDLKELLRGLGVQYIRTADPFRPLDMAATVAEAMKVPGVKVVIAQGECVLQSQRRLRYQPASVKKVYDIEPERCQKCDICFAQFACIAIQSAEEDGNTYYYIDQGLCNACGACRLLCPNSAIHQTELNPHLVGAKA